MRSRRALQRSLAALVLLAALGLVLGVAFAGSAKKLASGVTVAGVDVGGLAPKEARLLLERRARALENVPVVFTAGSRSWRIRPSQVGVRVDWAAAVAAAQNEGNGFGPVRGFRRIGVRLFGEEVAPPARVYDSALDYELRLIAQAIDRPHREAAIRLRGLRPIVIPARTGRVLDRKAAAATIVRALSGFSRDSVALTVRFDAPTVSANDLVPVATRVRTALSAPVRVSLGPTRWRLPRWRIAGLLDLPRDGSRTLRIGGPGADRYLKRLARVVDRPPRDADFAVFPGGVRIVPARPGHKLDPERTAGALLSAALDPTGRVAPVAVAVDPPARSTADARAMGITGLEGSYETFYGGDANRIHNVQLVARLLDRHLIGPGKTFSFNETTGERTADKGFLEAPVIINGELQTGLGGGVCQVSTTVFNAAYEAGLDITARTNHALYISHYPLGRDATVNYPDTDLRFVNDTKHWLLLRTFVGSSSLTVALYGTPEHRRVVSEAAPLVSTGSAPVQRVKDPSLPIGRTVVDQSGEPSRATSVRRRVYDADGKLLHDDTWHSSYRGETAVVRVGTKPKAKPKPKAGAKETKSGARPASGPTGPSAAVPDAAKPLP